MHIKRLLRSSLPSLMRACANVECREWITSLSVRIIALRFFFTSFQFPFVFTTIFGGSLPAPSSLVVRTANEQMLFECFIILSALAGAGAGAV